MWPNTLERRGFPVAGRRQPVRRTFRPFLEALESRLVLQGAAITSLSTSSVLEGSPAFTLGINGSGFAPGAFVFWNNTILPTTFVNGNQLNVNIPASLLTEDTSMMNGGPVAVSVLQNGSISNIAQLNINEAPIAVTGGFGFTGPLVTNGTVATFSDTGGAELPFPQDYQATINWGDNSISTGTITGPDQNGLFTVTGNHAYTTLSPYTISVTVTHETSPPVTITDVVNQQSQVGTNTLGPITGQELQPVNNVPVVTFQNLSGQPAGAFNATINWGDNSTSTGTISGPDQNGFFTVSGSHTYAEDGEVEQDLVDSFPITVTLGGGMSGTVTTTANIAEENTIVGPSGAPLITGQELQPINNVVVATFGNGNGQVAGAFHATINWGDGTTSAGTVSGPNQNGNFTVTGSHTYAEDGEVEQDLVDSFPVTVTITDGVSATVTTTANIAEENTIVGPSGAPLITGQELQPINNVVVATFGNSNGQPASAFHVTINWGDGTTSTGTVTGPDQNGNFTVTGSHTYAEDGEVEQDLVDSFPVTVTITDGVSATVTTTANISEETTIVGPSGAPLITGQELQPINNVVVATFGNGGGQPASAFHVTINWGDGTTSTGTVTGPDQNGVFAVTGNHTYAEDGEVEQDLVDAFPITVTITDGMSATVATTANISEESSPAPPPGGAAQGPTQKQPDSVSPVALAPADGAAFLATMSNSVQSGNSSQSDDAYWRLPDQRPGDLNDWASGQLALALKENGLRTSL